MRKDGKERRSLMLLALLGGLFGLEYFYIRKYKFALIKLGISWIGASFIVFSWVIYGTWLNNGETNPLDNHFLLTAQIMGAIILGAPLLWSFFNFSQIVMGSFKDENKTPVGEWNSSKEEFVEYLIERGVK